MSSYQHVPILRGRRTECNALDQLLARVRASQSQVLVLRGEAGVGKTSLLDYLAERASGCRIARATGVESEMELPFSGVHQLCLPMLDCMADLPVPQRDALATAFGLSSGETPDRFLIGLAVLHLLSNAAEDHPLVCLVDDAQWLDRASAQILAFVARRLQAEPVALVFAVRGPGDEPELAGLTQLTIGGLNDVESRALLDAEIHGRLDARVRDRIVAEARGNPLALLELPRGLTAAELAGGFGLPNAGPLASRLEQSFLGRVQELPVESQRFLLAAAADPVGDVTLLWRAVGRLGIGTEAATLAEAAGLIELGTRVRFRHPLVRSAVYRSATLTERQEIHRALAEATDPSADPDRRAWHRAQAAVGPDESVAGELERSAGRAQGRGGVAAAAAFLERATELTPNPARRGARALAAAQAKFEAGSSDAAYELLMAAETCPLDDLQRARLARLRAQIRFARRRGSDVPPLLLDTAAQLEGLDDELARETYLEALGAAIFAGRLGERLDVTRAAEAARNAPPAPQPPRPTDTLLDAVAMRFSLGYEASAASLKRALQALRVQAGSGEDDGLGWLWMGCPVAPEPVAAELWDDEAWHELASRAVALARERGALRALPTALTYRVGMHIHAGEFADGLALLEEADAISDATGHARMGYTSMLLVAWRGDESQALKVINADVRDATARGEGRVLGLVGYAVAVLYNGLGRYEEALAGARRGCDFDDLGFYGWSLVELVEAAARCGERDFAADALQQLENRANASGTDWALGSAARSRALLSDGDGAESYYRDAIEYLGRTRVSVYLARAHLVYGEWLRRENRRVDAREHLSLAYEMLSGFGAEAFAERARRELRATGETVRKRTVDTLDVLTAQEAQIARLAAEGHTNPEIGSQLFISPRTVEYHLGKVFSKLGISSRRELRGALRHTSTSA